MTKVLGTKAPDELHKRVNDVVARSSGRLSKSDVLLLGVSLALRKLERQKNPDAQAIAEDELIEDKTLEDISDELDTCRALLLRMQKEKILPKWVHLETGKITIDGREFPYIRNWRVDSDTYTYSTSEITAALSKWIEGERAPSVKSTTAPSKIEAKETRSRKATSQESTSAVAQKLAAEEPAKITPTRILI